MRLQLQMERGKEPTVLQLFPFPEFAMLLRLVHVVVSEVSNLIPSEFYLLLHGCNDGMRSQRYPMCDRRLDYEARRDQLR
jgi:hypothetical protein